MTAVRLALAEPGTLVDQLSRADLMSGISSIIAENFEIVSVRPSETPSGMEGSGWHCYEIAQGPNIIRGYRQGNLRVVTEAAEEIVTQLNERRLGKNARAQLAKSKLAKAAEKE